MSLEEERVHLLERVSSLQAAQSEHEKTVRKMQRDQEEQKTIIVRHVRTSRVVLTTLQRELESEKVLFFFPTHQILSALPRSTSL